MRCGGKRMYSKIASENFAKEFKTLLLKQPRYNLKQVQVENSEYSDTAVKSKNCYYCFGAFYCEDVYYGRYSRKCIGHSKKSATQHRKNNPRNSLWLPAINLSFRWVSLVSSYFVWARWLFSSWCLRWFQTFSSGFQSGEYFGR